MFIKDSKQRITIEQIMQTPIIMSALGEFVKIKCKIEDINIPFVVDLPNTSIDLALSNAES